MSEYFNGNTGRTLTRNVYVKADGRTVCEPSDKDVAEMRFGIGTELTEAQKGSLIFRRAPVAEPVPDAGQRASEVLPDAEKRSGKRGKLG